MIDYDPFIAIEIVSIAYPFSYVNISTANPDLATSFTVNFFFLFWSLAQCSHFSIGLYDTLVVLCIMYSCLEAALRQYELDLVGVTTVVS